MNRELVKNFYWTVHSKKKMNCRNQGLLKTGAETFPKECK